MIEEEKFYWTLLDALKDGVYFADKKRKITYWNKAAENITGYKSGEMLGRHCGDNLLIHIDENGNNLCTGNCPLSIAMESGKSTKEKIFLHHKDGHRVPVLVRINPVYGANNEIIGGVEIFTDLSTKNALYRDLQTLKEPTFQNPITGLPTQQYLNMHLKLKLMEWNDFKHPFGVFLIQINGLKEIKDSHGQEVFEKILKILSDTFSHNVESCNIIGQWTDATFMGIVSNADEQKLKENAEHYCHLLKNSILPVEDIKTSLKFSTQTIMAESEEIFESLIEKIENS